MNKHIIYTWAYAGGGRWVRTTPPPPPHPKAKSPLPLNLFYLMQINLYYIRHTYAEVVLGHKRTAPPTPPTFRTYNKIRPPLKAAYAHVVGSARDTE